MKEVKVMDNPEIEGKQIPELEQEANLFACLLLMPSQLIKQDLENGVDLGETGMISKLAKKYDVPENAVAYRILFFKEHGY